MSETRLAWCTICCAYRCADADGCIECWMKQREQQAAFGRKRYDTSLTSRRGAARRSQNRRNRLKAAGLCINGKAHERPQPGHTKCPSCVETHRRSR